MNIGVDLGGTNIRVAVIDDNGISLMLNRSGNGPLGLL